LVAGEQERKKKEGDLHAIGISIRRRDLDALEISLFLLSLFGRSGS
jgi:hypothetical protein